MLTMIIIEDNNHDADDADDEGDNADVDEERWLPLMLQSPLGVDNSQPLLIMQHQPNPRPHLSLYLHSALWFEVFWGRGEIFRA